jgi:hypothetical protein
MNPALVAAVGVRLGRPVPQGAHRIAAELRERYGAALAAVLFYGSNLRRGDDREGLLDLYALVDGYRAAYRRALPALGAWLLPPNVHYVETAHPDGGALRAKVAVVSLAAFARAMRPGRVESYFWGRFCQPSALVWARDPAATGAVQTAIAQAIETAVCAARAMTPAAGGIDELWAGLLDACYGAELRPERSGVGARLAMAEPDWYAAVTPLAAPAVPGLRLQGVARYAWEGAAPRAGPWAWTVRRAWGKARNLARLLKAAVTFAGGVDYILWKLERHTGAPVPRTALLHRFPLLGIWPVAWRAYRTRRPGA